MQDTFTIVLSKGAYVVDQNSAETVLAAIENGAKHVLIKADVLGDGLCLADVRVVTAHVISVLRNATELAPGETDRPPTLSLVRRG